MATDTLDHDQARAEERAARDQLRNLKRARRVKAEQRKTRERGAKARLDVIEGRMDVLAAEYRQVEADRAAIRKELRDLGNERIELRWGR